MNNKPNTVLAKEHNLRKAIAIRRRQIIFDNYPEGLQEFLTRIGLNPYKTHIDDMIEHRNFTVDSKEN